MDHLLAMRAFVRVVEAGTFTKAADSLEMQNSTVTKLVQWLEGHLTVRLLHRTTRRVTVTPEGAAYYDQTVRLLNDLDDIESTLVSARTEPRGKLRVDLPTTMASLLITPALPKFCERYPHLQVDLGASDRPVDLIGENVDCVLRAGKLTDPSLVARRIADLNFVTCASPDYLRQHPPLRHPSELEDDHQVVGFSPSSGRRPFAFTFVRDGETIEFVGRYLVSVNEGHVQIAAGLAGLGVIQLPAFMVKDHLEAGRLVAVLPDWSNRDLPLYVVYPPNRHLSNKVRVFVDWVAELFAAIGHG